MKKMMMVFLLMLCLFAAAAAGEGIAYDEYVTTSSSGYTCKVLFEHDVLEKEYELAEDIVSVFHAYYPAMFERYGAGEPKPVEVNVFSGTAHPDQLTSWSCSVHNHIFISRESFDASDINMLYLVMHLAQLAQGQYPVVDADEHILTLYKAMAVYMGEELYDCPKAEYDLYRLYETYEEYLNSEYGMADFIGWVAKEWKMNDLPVQLNAALREGAYDKSFWSFTGMEFDALFEMYGGLGL